MTADEEFHRNELVALLADILHWGDRVAKHVDGLSEADFLSDQTAADAVCWCIGCIGEAAGAIRRQWPDLESKLPALELGNAYAMRNRIMHGYASVDLRVVWRAATISVPRLVEMTRRHLDDVK